MSFYRKYGVLLLAICFVKISFAETFYIDPLNGDNITGNGSLSAPWQTLEYVINTNLIETHSYMTPYDASNPQILTKNLGAPVHEGDTLILFSGLHGKIYIENYINSDFITIKGADGHTPVIEKCHLRGAKNWRIENVTFSGEPFGRYHKERLIFLESHDWQGPVADIILRGNHIYSSLSPWTSAAEWVQNVSDGIYIAGDNIVLDGNRLDNTGFSVTLLGNHNHALNNTITNFSGDGIRILGSSNIVEANTIKNCYKVDDNHDDGIQSFTSGGLVVDSNQVIKNIILNYEDPSQPLLGDLQGIGCFDGPFNGWIVENNVISVNHWHGISMYGANNCNIQNNTVIDPNLADDVGPSWILIDDDGIIGAMDCSVKNNIVNTLSINASSDTEVGSNLLLNTIDGYANNFMDYAGYDFNLVSTSPAIDQGDNTCAPLTDIAGTDRPQGVASDIGAYEYIPSVSTIEQVVIGLDVYPIPANDKIYVTQEIVNAKITVVDALGKTVYHADHRDRLRYINVEDYVSGRYTITIVSNQKVYRAQFVKM